MQAGEGRAAVRGRSAGEERSISYDLLHRTVSLLRSHLLHLLHLSQPQPQPHITAESAELFQPVLVGIAIPSSCPLFTLCCQTLHSTHSTEGCTPLTLVPLDTEDPAIRSKHLLRCLGAIYSQSDSCDSPSLKLILTSGTQAVAHWSGLLDDTTRNQDVVKSSSRSCDVCDVELFILSCSELDLSEKRNWVWDNDRFINGEKYDITDNDLTQFESLSLWEDEDDVDDHQTDCMNKSHLEYCHEKDYVSSGVYSNPITVDSDKYSYQSTTRTRTLSHIAFTSGTSSGSPKGCCSSYQSLIAYCDSKNEAHGISSSSTVLLVSSSTFDPALSDVIATFRAGGTLVIFSWCDLQATGAVIRDFGVTHILGTPSWFTHTDCMLDTSLLPKSFPTLEVIALGGEVIPARVVQKWSRRCDGHKKICNNGESHVRLCVTYGVTEACVYQTFGEVFQCDQEPTACSFVGAPLKSVDIRISSLGVVDDTALDGEKNTGEIILQGSQLDSISGYFTAQCSSDNSVSTSPFFLNSSSCDEASVCYRTGDYGFLSNSGKELHLVGRIGGAPRLIKINGIRVDPMEVEAAILSEYGTSKESWISLGLDPVIPIVTDCAVTSVTDTSFIGDEKVGTQKILAYCVLSKHVLSELGIGDVSPDRGVVCPPSHLLTLLRMRCSSNLKRGVVPSAFIVVSHIPLTSTGKRKLTDLPSLSECRDMVDIDDGDLLIKYGMAGAAVSAEIIKCLNLQPCQYRSVTTKATFSSLGCDSLAITRIARALYASHHGVFNSRELGGKFGMLDADGPFAVKHMLRARTLRDYVSWLDSHGLCQQGVYAEDEMVTESTVDLNIHPNPVGGLIDEEETLLYNGLVESITKRQTHIALSLLAFGIDPKLSEHGGRLAKISGRLAMRKEFTSNPLHLSCMHGEPRLVKALVSLGYSCKSPDANGSFPIHLVCLSISTPAVSSNTKNDHNQFKANVNEEGANRSKCLKLLLDEGKVPLTMKDGNKQTILHCVARTGNSFLTQFVIDLWKDGGKSGEVPSTYGAELGGIWDWRDRWYRTPVQWAVLNGHTETLNLLLQAGCSPEPPRAKRLNRSTSAENETPIEICQRLFLASNLMEKQEKGRAIMKLLCERN